MDKFKNIDKEKALCTFGRVVKKLLYVCIVVPAKFAIDFALASINSFK